MRHALARVTLVGVVLLGGGLVEARQVGATSGLVDPAIPATDDATMANWSQLQGNAQHTGFAPNEMRLDAQSVRDLQIAWRAPLTQATVSFGRGTAVVADGTVYTAGSDVAAFDAVSGALQWRMDVGGPVVGTPAVAGGLVLVGVDQSGVVALDATSGARLWRRNLPTYGFSSVTVAGDRVFVTVRNQLVALRLKTGGILWSSAEWSAATCCEASTPSYADGLVLVGLRGSIVTAYDAKTGAQRWRRSFGTGSGSSRENWLPAVQGQVVSAGLLDGVAALDLATGKVIWFNDTDVAGVFFPLAVTATTVLAGGDGGDTLVALDLNDGSVKWRNDIDGQMAGVDVFGTLMWGARSTGVPQGTIEAYLRRTGRRVFSIDLGDGGLPPIVVNGRVYAATDAELVCLTIP
jgi:outer membrane protein assembly factor BamB